MRVAKRAAVLGLAAALALSSAAPAFASFAGDTQGGSAYQSWKSANWTAENAADSGRLAIAPGKSETDLNFAWYAQQKGVPAVKIATSREGLAAATPIRGTATAIDRQNVAGVRYLASNKVEAEGVIAPNTLYYYSYTDDVEAVAPVWSEPATYQSHGFDSFEVLYVGDPQVGASGSAGQGTTDDANIAVDTYNWDKTLRYARANEGKNASFMLVAGDQIDYSSADTAEKRAIRESEYAGYLYPEALKGLPMATTIGNHESYGDDYSLHYNTPNAEDGLGATASGSDYYFSYGDVLFIVLNSNNRNTAEHRQLMQKAVESHPDAKWRIAMFHHDIYGSGEPHASVDGANLRILFAPLMDQFNIDVCLTGHDHSYARTYQILDGKVVDYDESTGSIADPQGTLYMSAGSASGSKFYNLNTPKQYFVAERNNENKPTFSVIKMGGDRFSISTYDYEGNQYAQPFTIVKNADEESLTNLISQAREKEAGDYTEGSYAALQQAADEAAALLDTREDPGAEALAQAYDKNIQGDNRADPLNYYGYAQGMYQAAADGALNIKATTLKAGFSTLLDKTLHRQQNTTVSAADLSARYVALAQALDGLALRADADALQAEIARAEAALEAAEEGEHAGQYPAGSKAALQAAVEAARAVFGDQLASSGELTAATEALRAAVQAFADGQRTEDATPPSPDQGGEQTPDADPPEAGQPNTGDPSGVALLPLAGLGVLALAGAGACLAKRRRTR
ncbi:metallophosphoesterase [Bittarella massiliensis (ex Durand et al. 2017)]|uniref:metallophosphoesterase n=1 Tax=Bittarella massiliensis (ex Durand et al. 2017) TaxID=1720313 RepID=UPI0034A01CDA